MSSPSFFPDVAWEELAQREAEARRRSAATAQRAATPVLAQQVADMSFMYPNLPGAVVTATSLAGIDPMGDEMAQINQRALEADAMAIQFPDEEGPGNPLARGGKALLRGLFTGFDMVYDEVVRGITRLGYGAVTGQDDLVDRSFGQSAGAWAAQIRRQGHRVNLGSGILPNSELAEETIRRMQAGESIETAWRNPEQIELGLPITQFVAARRENPNEAITMFNPNATGPGEHQLAGGELGRNAQNLAITPGRAIARVFTQPGTTGFNIFSGIGDVAANIFLDPTNAVGGVVNDLRTANRLLLPSGTRQTVLARNVDDWLMSRPGQNVTSFLAQNRDFRTTYGLLSSAQVRRAPDAELVRAITEADNPADVANLIRNAVNSGNLSNVIGQQTLAGRPFRQNNLTGGLAGDLGSVAGIRKAVRNRGNGTVMDAWSAEVGGTTIRVDDVDDATFRIGEWMKVAGFEADEISSTMQRMAGAGPGQYEQMFGIVADTVGAYGRRLAEQGMPAPVVNGFERIFKDYSDARAYFIDAVGQPEMFPGAKFTVTLGGEVIEQPTAHLMAEFLSANIPLPDIRKVRQANRRANLVGLIGDGALNTMRGKIEDWDDLQPGVVTSLMDNLMGRVWKPAVLLRLAWPVRVIGEEQVRMAASGLDSAFRHPLHWLALATGRKGDIDVTGRAFAEWKNGAQAGALVDDVGQPLDEAGKFRKWVTGLWEYESAEFAAAMSRKGGQMGRGGRPGMSMWSRDWERAQRGVHPRHMEGWAIEMSKLARDPIASRVAKAMVESPFDSGVDDVVAALVRDFTDDPTELGRFRKVLEDDGGRWAALSTPEGAEGYIRSILARITRATGGKYEKFDHVTGKWLDMAGNELPMRFRPPDSTIGVGAHIQRQLPAGGDLWVFDRVTYQINPDEFGNADLMRAIAEGRLGASLDEFTGAYKGGVKMGSQDWADEAAEAVDIKRLANRLEEWRDFAPEFTTVARPADPNAFSKYDRIVDVMFTQLMSRPTNYLSRSPAFKQFYWKKVAEFLPAMDNATQAAAIRAAREAGLGRGRLRSMARNVIGDVDPTEAELTRLAGVFADARRGGTVTDTAAGHLNSIDDVDELAKAFALEQTKRLLYDVDNKTNAFDILRNVFPFGEAWAEIMSTWFRLVTDDPTVLRRAQQGIEAMRDGDLDGDGRGVFYEDPDTGEEVFSFPGTAAMTKFIYGDENGGPRAEPVFTGRVSGLNLALGSFVPGVGPTVQIPLAHFGEGLLADPDFRWLREFAFPFAAPDIETAPDAFDAMLPAWFRKAQIANPFAQPSGRDLNVFNNTIKDVLKAMEVNGEIDYRQPGAMQAAIDKATQRAKWLWAIRSMSQFVGPVGAQVRWDVTDPNANTTMAFSVLAEEYRSIQDRHPGDDGAAFREFTERYGLDPTLFATPKSLQVVPRSVTAEGQGFQAENPELFERFGLTAYFANPDDPDAEFDYGAYITQFSDGTRVALDPDEWVRYRNGMAGRLQYFAAKDRLGPMADQQFGRLYLSQLRAQLMEEYPGYGYENFGAAVQADPDEVRAEFEEWLNEPALLETSAGRGLALYLEKRRQMLKLARVGFGVSENGFGTAQATEPLRRQLANYAAELLADPAYVDFAPIFQRYYQRETETDMAPAFQTPEAMAALLGDN